MGEPEEDGVMDGIKEMLTGGAVTLGAPALIGAAVTLMEEAQKPEENGPAYESMRRQETAQKPSMPYC